MILAAGAATRMGQSKQLLAYRGEALVERAVREAREAGFTPIIVVIGAGAQAIRDKLAAEPVFLVENERWQTGMGSSIAAGVQFLRDLETDAAAVAILLADQPFVAATHLREMRSVFSRAGGAIVAARYNGTVGVPALFKRALFGALAVLDGETGARSLLRSPESKIVEYDLPEAAVDIDTPEDFATLSSTV